MNPDLIALATRIHESALHQANLYMDDITAQLTPAGRRAVFVRVYHCIKRRVIYEETHVVG